MHNYKVSQNLYHMKDNKAFQRFVRTCGENELGCSYSGSGVSDV